MEYLLDSSTILDLLRKHKNTQAHFQRTILQGHNLLLTPPVYYEVLRGLIRYSASGQMQRFDGLILPVVEWVPLTTPDWQVAAQLWADLQSRGRALSDVDVLIATVCLRIGATLVSADADFDALPTLSRADWRAPLPNA
jgi:predicted nucleic acid-binding protein